MNDLQPNTITAKTNETQIKPQVVWFYGLSGSGKTTLSRAVAEKLKELNCIWGEKAHNAMEIKNLCIGIGSDKELLNEEFIFLQEQLKKSLGCPKKVSVDLIDKSRLIANPPPPPPQIPALV